MRIFKNSCIACVELYRWFLAPLLMSLGVQCRFIPSCSEFALGALETHGAVKGSCLSLKRLLRCHPFCQGGHDPVPELSRERGRLGRQKSKTARGIQRGLEKSANRRNLGEFGNG